MGLQAVPAYIAASGFQHPATLDRNILEKVFGGRTGATRAGEFLVYPGGGTRAISVEPGGYHIVGTENSQQGGYFAWSDAAEVFLLAAAVGNPRIDTLLLRIHDDQYGTIPGSPGAYYEVVQGVAAASPTARVDADFNVGGSFYVPGAWARISDVRVNVGDVAIPGGQITNTQRYARHNGWTICSSGTRPTDPVINDRIYEYDTDMRRRWNGTAWVQCEAWTKVIQLVSPAAEINMTGIPSTLRSLDVKWSCRHVAAVEANFMLCKVNNAGANHVYTQTIVQNVTTGNTANSQGGVGFPVGLITGASAPAGFTGSGHLRVDSWHAPNSQKPRFIWQSGAYGTTAATAYDEIGQGTYNAAGPYTQLRFVMLSGSNFDTGSWVTIEGWE